MLEVAVVLASLAIALVVLLAAPVSLLVRVERTAALDADASCRIVWLFGLVNLSFRPGKSARQRDSQQPGGGTESTSGASKSDKSKSDRRSHARRGPAVALALLRTCGFVRRVLRLLADLGRQVRFEDLYLRAEFGLDDPADTGWVYGALAPLLVAGTRGGFNVAWQPNFNRAGLQGSCGGRMRVRPISLVAILVGFLCSFPTLRAMRAVWLARR